MGDTPHGWTPETLFIHFSALRDADRGAVKTALDSSDKRLDGMNEFRKTVEDVNKNSLTRKEALTFLAGVIATVGTVAATVTAIAVVYNVFVLHP